MAKSAKVEKIELEEATDELVRIRPLGPGRDDPGHSDFCLSLLQPGEFVKGKGRDEGKIFPKVVGLRRLVRLLYGEIVASEVTSISTPGEPYRIWAIVVHRVVVKDRGTGEQYVYSEVGDVNEDNLTGRDDDEMDFLKFAVRTASTQAESRALRKFLNLNVCAIEELSERKAISLPMKPDSRGSITPTQKKGILKFCRDLGLDADAFVAENSRSDPPLTSLDQLSEEQAKKTAAYLDRMNRGRPSVPLEI